MKYESAVAALEDSEWRYHGASYNTFLIMHGPNMILVWCNMMSIALWLERVTTIAVLPLLGMLDLTNCSILLMRDRVCSPLFGLGKKHEIVAVFYPHKAYIWNDMIAKSLSTEIIVILPLLILMAIAKRPCTVRTGAVTLIQHSVVLSASQAWGN